MKTRKVKPCGMLHSNFSEWFLLHPYPVVKDSWQDDSTHRFLGVPSVPENWNDDVNPPIYSYARHIVTNSFTIEYMADMQEIEIKVLEDIDVTETELHDISDEEISNILNSGENDYGI